MHYTKPPTAIADQIAQLEKRGLIIKDKKYAKHYLSHVSYYRLAGYWWPLQSDKINHIFKPNSDFETVIAIYKFDAGLRKLLFDVIEEIEIAFRSKMIYHLSHEYSPWWFEDPANFKVAKEHTATIGSISRELGRNRKEVFLAEHFKKYNTDTRMPPAWKTLEIASFGTLSKLYGNLSNKCIAKDTIAAEFGTFNHSYLHSWLQSISQIRNMCAHHGRIWNKNLPGRPKLFHTTSNPWLRTLPPSKEHHMLYVHLCCMKYLLNIVSPNNSFTYRLYILLKNHPNIDIKALGMPVNWYKEPLWSNRIRWKNLVIHTINKVRYLLLNITR